MKKDLTYRQSYLNTVHRQATLNINKQKTLEHEFSNFKIEETI